MRTEQALSSNESSVRLDSLPKADREHKVDMLKIKKRRKNLESVNEKMFDKSSELEFLMDRLIEESAKAKKYSTNGTKNNSMIMKHPKQSTATETQEDGEVSFIFVKDPTHSHKKTTNMFNTQDTIVEEF